jgi:hypothetical protein
MLNLALPQFPVGTQVALVRQAIVIDDRGELEPTAQTESVQLRVYHAITPGTQAMNFINGPSSSSLRTGRESGGAPVTRLVLCD